jgi:hypothetical protein
MTTIPGWQQAAHDAAMSRVPGYEQLKSAPATGRKMPAGSIITAAGTYEGRRAQALASEAGGARTALKAEGFSEAQVDAALRGGRR